MISLQEAFTKLNMLEANNFNLLDEAEKDAMKKFLEDDEEAEEVEEIDVIDPEAADEFELEDSYVGKALVECPVCKSPIFRTFEEMEANKGQEETCPYCQSVVTMDIIGKIVAMDEEPAAEEPAAEEPAAEADEAPIEECKDLHEDLENVTIETEDEVINVSAEQKDECPECDDAEKAEVIAPLDGDQFVEDEPEADDDEIDEFDEESFDRVAESFFRENYNNVKGFKTKKAYDKGNHIVVEGIVTLKDGSRKLTEFRVRPGKFDKKTNRAACLIENLQLNKKKVVTVRAK